MRSTVYLETTIIGYLASWPSRDLITAANQQLTHEWWNDHRQTFDLYVSQFVIDECSAGDKTAAQERAVFLTGIPELSVSDDVKRLAEDLVQRVPLPEKGAVDALHIAVAAVHGIDYLLTWNCAHIANASLRPRIEALCRAFGHEPPTICTPQELLES